MATSNGISNRAQIGFAKSAAYDQYRPAYSDTITQLLLEKLDVNGKEGAKIVDLAAGTGKFTESLARREEVLVARRRLHVCALRRDCLRRLGRRR